MQQSKHDLLYCVDFIYMSNSISLHVVVSYYHYLGQIVDKTRKNKETYEF